VGRHLARRRPWRTVAASVVGTSHSDAGQPCADACRVRVFPTARGGSILVAAVADGAGSSEHAPEGARLAVEAVLEQAQRWVSGKGGRPSPPRSRSPHGAPRRRAGSRPGPALSRFSRREVVRWTSAARRRIADAAASRGLESRAFSCTLLVALVDETSAVFFQVGDGAIVYRGESGLYVPALWPQSGEYANCTWFVTDEDVADRVESAVAEGVHEVALLSDGLQGIALRLVDRQAHGPFFEPMFARLRTETELEPPGLLDELRSFLESPAVSKRTDDDKTLVLATRLPASPAIEAPVEAEA